MENIIYRPKDDYCTYYLLQNCQLLKLKHHIHFLNTKNEKNIIERTIQYIKDRTECFDDYFPCRKKKCKLKHVQQWLDLFADYYNKEITPYFIEP